MYRKVQKWEDWLQDGLTQWLSNMTKDQITLCVPALPAVGQLYSELRMAGPELARRSHKLVGLQSFLVLSKEDLRKQCYPGLHKSPELYLPGWLRAQAQP